MSIASRQPEQAPRTMLHGFVDHHCHFRAWAAKRLELDLHDVTTTAELHQRIAGHPGDWVIGRGLSEAMIAHHAHHAEALDAAAHHRPVALTSRDGHALITTPRTLAELDLALVQLRSAGGGVVEMLSDESWSGVLREEAAWMVRRALPKQLTPEGLREAVSLAASRGITGLHDMDGLSALRDWSTLHDLDGKLDARVTVHVLATDLDHIDEARTMERADLLRIGGLKLFADGTLGSGTAHLHAPELQPPGQPIRRGMEILSREELITFAQRGAAAGLPLLVHAIGDAAATNVIDALEATHDAWKHLPAPRVEHAQLMRPSDIERCARLGITCSVQPAMLVTDRDEADAHWGAERTPHAFAFRSMLDAGCRIEFGSDAPVEPLRPLASIYAAVHRNGGAHGLPTARESWQPQQCIDIDSAIGAATGWRSGIIDTDADAVVIEGTDLATWRVVGTRLGARWTFRSAD